MITSHFLWFKWSRETLTGWQYCRMCHNWLFWRGLSPLISQLVSQQQSSISVVLAYSNAVFFFTPPWWDAAHLHWNNNSNLIWDKWCLCLLSTGTTKTIGTQNTFVSRAPPSPIYTYTLTNPRAHLGMGWCLFSVLQRNVFLEVHRKETRNTEDGLRRAVTLAL